MEIKDYPKYEKINESQKLKMAGEFIHYLGDFRENLYYSFRFRDLSKEAIMDLAEGMVF